MSGTMIRWIFGMVTWPCLGSIAEPNRSCPCPASSTLGNKCFLTFFPDRGKQHRNQQQGGDRQQERTQRLAHEKIRPAPRQNQGAAQILFHWGTQDEPEQQRGRLASKLHEDVSEQAEQRHQVHV